MLLTTLAETIPDSSIITIGLPWAVWIVIGGVISGSFAWIARLCLKALNESRTSSQTMHNEVVALTREVVQSQTAVIAAINSFKDLLQQLVQKD